MTPADIIRPFLLEADRRKPHLRIDNRFWSCFELLEDAMALAGPDWQFIGKSGRKGEAGVKPAWFTETWLSLKRDDGQLESVLIDQLGMDAAWYMPTNEQVKVIANSTANELPIGDPRRGPANLTPYPIERQWYRWHNPPIPQRGGASVPVPPSQPPVPSPAGVPGREEALSEMNWLDAYYMAPEGLQRPQGLSLNGAPDFEGVAAWYLDVYQKARMAGKSRADARAEYVSQIRHSAEWQAKHPGQTP